MKWVFVGSIQEYAWNRQGGAEPRAALYVILPLLMKCQSVDWMLRRAMALLKLPKSYAIA